MDKKELELIKTLRQDIKKYQEAVDKLHPADIMRAPLLMRLRDLKSALARLTGETITLNDRNDYKEAIEYVLESKPEIKKVFEDKYYIKGVKND